MSPDDPRHGTYAGHKAHQRDTEPSCRPCMDAAALYQYERERDRIAGLTRTVDPRGFMRRVHALRAIGWSWKHIAAELDMDWRNLHKMTTRDTAHIRRSTHERMVEVYERLCMRPPTDEYANRRRIIARRAGCVPPLDWDDIDLDDTPALPVAVLNDEPDVDEMAVQRAFDGDTSVLPLNAAERLELVRRWLAAGRTTNVLEQDYGINPWREVKALRAAETAPPETTAETEKEAA